MSSVTLKDLSKSFGATQVLHGLNLDVGDGEVVVFLGPSGCGKSTLLRMIAGLEDVTSGDIYIGDERVNDVQCSKRGISMVFQNYALYPHMTARQNMAFGLKMDRKPRREIERLVAEAAEILGIEPLLDRRPAAMSGGQRQRVAIGRAITRHPDVFLFDEPLSNLDAELRVRMRVEIAKLHRALKATMIYVTHDQVEAMTLADKIVVMLDGRIEQVGTPEEIYQKPANRFVAGFVGSPRINLFKAGARPNGQDSAIVSLNGTEDFTLSTAGLSITQSTEIELGVRPENLSLRGDTRDASFQAAVQHIEYTGGLTYFYLSTPDNDEIIASSAEPQGVKIGDDVTVSFYIVDCHLFSADGTALT